MIKLKLVICIGLCAAIVAQAQLPTCRWVVDNLIDPPMSYRPAPFWVWHDRVDSAKIERDLGDFVDVGMGGIFIHPRYGLITEYLSDEWFDRVQFSLDKTKQNGLALWLYDENSFPSGFAGGWVPEVMPESYNQGQGLLMRRVDEIPAGEFALILLDQEDGRKDITADAPVGAKGRFIVFEKTFFEKSKWYAGRSYVDLLIPGVTEKFIELTMSGYEKRFGQQLGKTIQGVFTDEPNVNPQHGGAIRWTPALFDEFQKQWGYDLRPLLPSLFEETGDWKRVRHNYYQLLLELFIENWSKPWYEYTEKHGLIWTGHYWEHGWPEPTEGSDNMAMYAWHQMPGIDMLFNTMDSDRTQFGNIRAVKELSSVANQLGRTRTLSETYGAAGWELTFADMKRLGDWEYVLGVNFMNQHLAYMNLTGDRKHDFPQGICYQTPWWPHYRTLNDYFARLSMVLSTGEQVNDILVLEPTTTAWMYYSPLRSNDRLKKIDESFHQFLAQLEKHHIEYDLGCENIIKDHGHIEDNQLVVGERPYSRILIPPFFENMDSATLELVRAFVSAGGHVLDFSDAELMCDGTSINSLPSLSALPNWHTVRSLKEAFPNGGSTFVMLQPEKIKGNLLHMRRLLDDGQLLFLTNSSREESAVGAFRLSGRSVTRLDPLSGQVSAYPAHKIDGQIIVEFTIPPIGSLLLLINNEQSPAVTSETPADRPAATTPLQIARKRPNMLPLDYCNLHVAGQQFENLYYYSAGYKIWQAHGYDENPWVSSVQWKDEWVKADTFAVNSGFEAKFPFVIAAGVDLTSLKGVVEQPDLWQVQINGHAVKALPNEWAIDKTWGVFDLSSHVRIGENDITIIMHPMSIYAEIEPVYIMGNFDLESQSHGWKLVPATSMSLGAWQQQGLPFYAYEVGYRKSTTLRQGQKTMVKLGEWQGTVASIEVNGVNAGIIDWQPFELDITPFIEDGDNHIEVSVIGSLKNLLGPFHNVNRRGIVTPWSFKYAPEQQPSGENYDVLDYGLMQDFQILVQ